MSVSTCSRRLGVSTFRAATIAAVVGGSVTMGLLVTPLVAMAAIQNVTIHGASPVTFAYAPSGVAATAGDTVHWTNGSTAGHTVTRCDATNCSVGAGSGTSPGAFDSGNLAGNSVGSYNQVFSGAGTYNYYCNIHGYAVMHGTVTVSAAAVAAPTATAGATLGVGTAPRMPPAGTGPRAAGRPAGVAVVAVVLSGLFLLLVTAGAVSTSSRRRRRR